MTALVLALGLLLQSPQAAAAEDVKAVKKVYDTFAPAFNAKDWKRVGTFIADDFVHESPGKPTLDKGAFLKERAASLGTLQNLRFVVTDFSNFKTTSRGTSVELHWVVTATYVDAKGTHPAGGEGIETHRWKEINGRWLLNAIIEKSNSFSIDGVVVDRTPVK